MSVMVPEAVRQFFVKHGVKPCRIVVAVSGGFDSTALLLALAELRGEGFDLVAAHVNHHLRGAESDADEDFVRALCADAGVVLHVEDGPLDGDALRDRGVEAAAREVRYRRLREIRERTGARFVATAHQKNDQAETVLMRLLTGSGIAGLRGIHPIRADGFVRPLLDVTRAEIDAFLRERGVTPRHDRSNEDPRFLRNRIRATVGALGAVDALASVAAQARAQWAVLDRAIDESERAGVRAAVSETTFVRWPEDPWLRQALLRRHIDRLDPHAREVSSADLARLAAEVDGIKRVSVTKTLELVRGAEGLVLRRRVGEFAVALTAESAVTIAEIGLTVGVRRRDGGGSAAGTAAFRLPEDAEPAFVVRNRRGGDRFQAKRLKDFLIDRKIAAEIRDRLPLLLWNDEIVWVAGVEVSERFKVTGPGGVTYEVWLEESGAADTSGLQR